MPTKTTLYALGSNGNSQLGVGHADDISSPQKCKFMTGNSNEVVDYVPLDFDANEQIKKIVAGGNHTLLLTTLGCVWATGSDVDGQCGLVGPRPQQVEGGGGTFAGVWRRVQWRKEGQDEDSRFTDIAATWVASFFVVDGHVVYSCGRGEKGELGRGLDRSHGPLPMRCFDLRDFEAEVPEVKIVKISACMNHVVVLSSSGSLYGWGACRKGQLGENLNGEKVSWLPKQLDIHLDWMPRQVVTGREFTFVVGKRHEEQCFLGDAGRIKLEMPLKFETESQQDLEIHAGWTHIVVRVSDGSLRGSGHSQRGQLLEKQPQQQIANFAMGSEHSIAVTGDGAVIAWGWGEHGNCGAEVDEKKNVMGRHNTVFVPDRYERVAGVGAGCATSFFWVEV
ncbi:alpha tubulin suppressor [Knufia obscura]|uniref:Alpha tubulin suppressor n=2 Tax=Knufia TaxID=430999 RepID=A0AAN8IIW9_9EURO|nr:alpha tubulin suppressor [Knufia obscura]KAK5949507.1 alpha tubulin suppressor [Knufia fluminis]